MANEVHTPPESSSMTGLVGGIVTDIGDLIKQQFTLVQKEVTADVRKARDTALLLAPAVGTLALGVTFLCVSLVHLLHWATSPLETPDPSRVPLWGCWAIVGALLAVVGGGLFAAGRQKLEALNPPLDKTAQTVKENVEWMTNASSK